MGKKDECKKLMAKFFGPASAAQVDDMGEEECVAKCKAKVAGMIGSDAAKDRRYQYRKAAVDLNQRAPPRRFVRI